MTGIAMAYFTISIKLPDQILFQMTLKLKQAVSDAGLGVTSGRNML